MKLFWIAVLTTVFFVSCAEEFMYTNPELFNTTFKDDARLTSPEKVIEAWYRFDKNGARLNLTIAKNQLADDLFEVTLINDGMEDDSVEAEKLVMTVRKTTTGWLVEEVKSNYKCHDGRGHTNWGIQKCN